ncbi:2-hydroxyacid dehydrogenase [Halalkalibacter hemicellulosilyticus]|uniref:Glyoxylate reductase n=1 Tax=Halalkalibacter hemicellulosilyticusJCM 9152 TaxID=1236971 RepID=W4QLE8_9BACI|nr:D-glycerate dehydrogenase [Halalkalibacter hemicellulosilyticus]GAE32184.1 glyoxylate reductase [Halalkalibacter hemicellulosilyticusJCM 9152]
MSRPIVFSDKPLPKEIQAYLANHVKLTMWEEAHKLKREQLFEKLQGVDGFMTSGELINEELLQNAPNLRAVSTISVGYDHFDLNAMRKHQIIGTHTPYVLDDTVADLVLSLMLATARRIPELDALTKSGCWKKGDSRQLFGVDVHHKKLGIIGMGRIGEKIAKRAKYGFDMDVSYFNRKRKKGMEQQLGLHYEELEVLLRESDFIVLMVPLTNETKHFIGAHEFTLMKPSSIFINASRGQTVDEEAMTEALLTGEILAAGLDVYEQEPIHPTNPLLNLKNVVTLPHIGSATSETRDAMAMMAAKNIVAALTGVGSCYKV